MDEGFGLLEFILMPIPCMHSIFGYEIPRIIVIFEG